MYAPSILIETKGNETDLDTKLTYSVEEAARLLGIGRSLAYELCRTGELPCIRLRGRVLVSKAALGLLLGENQKDHEERVQ